MSRLASRKLTIALFAFYLAVLCFIILLKTTFAFGFLNMHFVLTDPNIERSINLVPFGAMLFLNEKPAYSEIIFNALAFVPFGVFVCMLRRSRTAVNLIAPIALTSLCLETVQYAFALGVSDITDVIANTLGGVIGIGVFYGFRAVCGKEADSVMNAIALTLAAGFMLALSMVRPL